MGRLVPVLDQGHGSTPSENLTAPWINRFAGIHDHVKIKTFDFAPQDRIKTKTARDKDKRPISLQVARVPPSPFHGKGGTLAT